MPYDTAASDALLRAMTAAGHHDTPGAHQALVEARTIIGQHPHKTHTDLDAAEVALAIHDWCALWHHAYQGIVNLTWAFAPEPSVCPPYPHPTTPFAPIPAPCPQCGAEGVTGARFCAGCGTRLRD